MALRSPVFPTNLHRQTAELAAGFFAPLPEVDTVLVVNSCARGAATPQSDLDMQVLVRAGVSAEAIEQIQGEWDDYAGAHPLIRAFKAVSRFAHVHLDVVDGVFVAEDWDDGGGPDDFEVGIGNLIAYSAPMGEVGAHFEQLRSKWLPYYDEGLRAHRLSMVRDACRYDLGFIPFYVRRELYFQAFDRLYKAHREFLQAVFIKRRVYPLTYIKWIRQQVEGWLGLTDLYAELPRVLSITRLDSDELVQKADHLHTLIDAYT